MSTSANRSHLAATHPGIQCGDNHRPQVRRRHRQEPELFISREPTAPPIVLMQFLDQRLRSAPEGRLVEVLAPDRPVQHVPKQFDGVVD